MALSDKVMAPFRPMVYQRWRTGLRRRYKNIKVVEADALKRLTNMERPTSESVLDTHNIHGNASFTEVMVRLGIGATREDSPA